ncbi:MAG: hypothetical protein ABI663_21845 [Chryseolinea sp.]
MMYTKKNVMERDKDSLIQIVIDLQLKLKKKNEEILRTRTKLNAARTRMQKMDETVRFQRNRILELYPAELVENDIRTKSGTNSINASTRA